MRGPPMSGGMSMRNGGGYDRGVDRAPMTGGYDDRYNGYGGDDRRSYAGVDTRTRDPYAAPPPMYPDDRRGYTAPLDDMAAMYPDERQAPMYPDERGAMDRRPPMRSAPMSAGYDRAPPPRAAPMGNGDMYSRRAEPAV